MDSSIINKLKKPLKEISSNKSIDFVATVCIQTYQHEKYIEECVNSILNQKTDFDFEILIGEDASSDNTRKICIDFANRYPDKIRLILHNRENNIAIDGSPTGRFNMLYNIYNSKGEYVALCEGDDFWKDENKLQNQVDFLRQNPEYGLVHSDIDLFNESANINISHYFRYNKIKHKEDPSVCDIISGYHPVVTCSILFRKSLSISYIKDQNYLNFQMGDYPLFCEIASKSKVHFEDKVTATRRLIQESASQTKKVDKKISFIKSGEAAALYIIDKFNCSQASKDLIKISSDKRRLKLFFESRMTNLLKESIDSLAESNYKFSKAEMVYKLASISPFMHRVLLPLYNLAIATKKFLR